MDEAPFAIEGAQRGGRWVVLCDHATNRVPGCIGGGSLGLSAADMARHIAWDVGALGVARALAGLLDAPLVFSRFSRLVIDPNRGEDDPTLVMRLYDGSIIPANRNVDAAEIARRLAAFHRPYHAAVARVLAARPEAAVVSVHSFTPQLAGRPVRPWHVGVLSSHDRRLADPLLDLLAAQADLCVGDNEPYSGHLPGDTMDRHALRTGRLHALIELRNDLIGTDAAQRDWAERLAGPLKAALARAVACAQ
ncbi:MAG: N-formylglutamate amidohydrolase [Alphaproteobacteria bacterium]|nr:MAG: N-formylglutamate amidohydrolase [Alphaproteobacteria bacterium]